VIAYMTRYVSLCLPCEVSWADGSEPCFCCGEEGSRVLVHTGWDTLLSLVTHPSRVRHQRWMANVEAGMRNETDA